MTEATKAKEELDTFYGFSEGYRGREPDEALRQEMEASPAFVSGYYQGLSQYEEERSLQELAALRESSMERDLDRDPDSDPEMDEPDYC